MRRKYNILSNDEKRKLRVRKKLKRNTNSLRLSVFKSNRHFYAQLIDDENGVTLASASTLDSSIRGVCKRRVNSESIKYVSALMAERLSGLSFDKQLVLDCGVHKYAGLVSQFADTLRDCKFKF